MNSQRMNELSEIKPDGLLKDFKDWDQLWSYIK